MVSRKYRGSCIGAALTKWLAKNTVASQKMALDEKMEDGALEMLLLLLTISFSFHTVGYHEHRESTMGSFKIKHTDGFLPQERDQIRHQVSGVGRPLCHLP